ncbi:MAG TPA: hypothetical protein VNE83_00450, partial [Terriglobales bacterium]|nr:hypothetical protein [Terriglobales bacterium]
MPPALDLARTPCIVIWELTQACDPACVHCRASARPHLVEYGTQLGVRVSLTPSATPLLEAAWRCHEQSGATSGSAASAPPVEARPQATSAGVPSAQRRGGRGSDPAKSGEPLTQHALAGLKARGLARLAISIDGADAASHDRFRGVPGAFDRALATVGWARELGLPVQINTTMSRHNKHDFDALAALMQSLDIVLIPAGRAILRDGLDGEAIELLFERLYALSLRARFDVKTTEVTHYRRYVAQQRKLTRAPRPAAQPHPDGIGRAPRGLNDGKGFVFISHLGEVYPSGFMPLSTGNVRRERLADIICGGSRA